MFKPTRYDDTLVYGSKTILSVETSTNDPLIKYVPDCIPTADPIAEALSSTSVITVSPSFTAVFPYMKDSSVINISPSSKNDISLLSPDLTY